MSAHNVRPSVWKDVRRVLAVRLDNLGDVLMTTPALAAIRHSLPMARLSLLTSPGGVMAAAHVPELDDAIAFDAPWMKSYVGGSSNVPILDPILHLLREMRFDAAIIFNVCTQSSLPAAMLCFLAGIPLRLAYCRENPYALLTDWVPDGDVVQAGMRHEVERQLALVGHVGMHTPSDRLRFVYSSDDRARMLNEMRLAGLDPACRYFVVHVGASAPSRRYPAESFGVAARFIADESGAVAVFSGSSQEDDLVAAARSAMGKRSVSLAGHLRLGELGALIDGAAVLVSNNSGPVHIAAAVGTPVVDLYALTNPQHTPWRVAATVLHQDVPCRYCLKSECPEGHHICLRGVLPHRVAEAALALMTPAQASLDEPILQPLRGLLEAG